MPKCSNWAPGPATRRAMENGEEVGVVVEFNPGKPMSKAAKKNAKRRANKQLDDAAALAPIDDAVPSQSAPAASIHATPTDGPQPDVSEDGGAEGCAGSSRAGDEKSRLHYMRGDATTVSHGRGYKVIAHVCNDLGRWGKGFVMAISAKWPGVATEYRRWHKAGGGFHIGHQDEGGFRLGAVQMVAIDSAMCKDGKALAALKNASGGLAVANIIGQHGIIGQRGDIIGQLAGSGGPPVRYEAIEEGLLSVGARAVEAAEASRLAGAHVYGAPSVHMPRIGSGLAGGEWARIEPLILRMLAASPSLEAYVYDWDG